jgi:hypothetical protein
LVKAPVSFYVFNRPDETGRVLNVLRQVKPATLIVHADGPRPQKEKDEVKCREVRALIETVDWDCEVIKNYSDQNLGSFVRITSGFDFAFKRFDRMIVLEDDCLPDLSFFPFCDELLERYQSDARVSMIGGFSNLNRTDHPYSYFFSRYTMSWGWAMWRRTWNLVDLNMSGWREIRENGLQAMVPERWIRNEWIRKYDAIYSKKLKNGWDYQLQLSGWTNNMLAIIPKVNLIQNIGYGADATHTQDTSSRNAKLLSSRLEIPLQHPPGVFRDVRADRQIERIHFERNVPRIIARQQVEAVLSWFGFNRRGL